MTRRCETIVPPSPRRPVRLAACAAIVLAATLPYVGVLHAPFVFDDVKLVAENPLLRVQGDDSLERLSGAFAIASRRWEREEVRENYRPLRFLSYWLDYQLTRQVFASFAPESPPTVCFHLQNLFWHALNALLVLGLGRRLLGGWLAAWLAAALFAVHPLQTEAVAYVSGRRDVLSTFFFLAAVWLHLRSAPAERPRWIAVAVAPALFAVGLLAKEMVITLPALVFWLDAVRRTRWSARRILLYAALWAVAAASASVTLSTPGLVAGGGDGALEQLVMACRSIGRYLGLLLLPLSQSVDYSFAAIEPQVGLSSPLSGVASIGAVALLLAVCFWSAVRGFSLVALGIGWFLGTLVPVLQFVPIAEQFAERFAYLPSVGVFLLGAAALGRVRAVRPRLGATVAALIVTVLAGATVLRNRDWRSPIALWGAAARAEPRCARAHAAHGDALREESRWQEALDAYNRALGIWAEEDVPPPLRRGQALRARLVRAGVQAELGRRDPSRLDAAIDDLRFVLSQEDVDGTRVAESPRHVLVHIELGSYLYARGRRQEAAAAFERVLAIGGPPATLSRAQYLLGKLRLEADDVAGAVERYRAALRVLPAEDLYRVNLVLELVDLLDRRSRDADGAWNLLEEALAWNLPGRERAPLLLRRAKLLDAKGEVEGAVQALEKAVAADPSATAALVSLADIESNQGRASDARRHYAEALRRDRSCASAREGLRRLELKERLDREDSRENRTAEMLRGIRDKALGHLERGELLAARDMYGALIEKAAAAGELGIAADAYVGVARAEARLFRHRKAWDALESALRLAPLHAEARRELGGVLLAFAEGAVSDARVADALSAYKRWLEAAPPGGEARRPEIEKLVGELELLEDEP